ncbi:phosphate ABC transporter permease subunit PstC [Aliigemmobacter aestuarii]|uniref:Phosphate transport system permease protein n=1 Tax=Aliigemmobacter aestuarii TaxID=1445661 RepID=A0A4S3MK70_9RHOB|nr:phosphate ABC transporter permease subunit PstC [Gemmobacter aestuarii]THD82356.1 phosphate ABC transporter permease subunit PstC [Gemmobacter aestuarii]
MTVFLLTLVIIAIALAGFFLGRGRAISSVTGDVRRLHSLPGYHGWHAALMVLMPAFGLLLVWLVAQPVVLERQVLPYLPAEVVADDTARTLAMADVRRVATGLDAAVLAGTMTEDAAGTIRAELTDLRARLAEVGVALGSDVKPETLQAAQAYRTGFATAIFWRGIITIAAALAGLGYALSVTRADFRARNRVEAVTLGILITASSIAILTTVGIIWSMLSESVNFFRQYPAADFFFGLTWSPNFRGGSELGFIPLLWGTLYISFVAMVVAVPLGLFTAIYLAEYASARTRSIIKPLIEVIAGIPTVVFGLFALVTVGPFLRDYFAEPFGLGNSGSSVMTAGIVIGILNIPFISSLADDIINSVPQAMRDGSYGLGATKSETVRQVILPAALPGIVGAVLLAASRAIGETMIVTMGAGAAAKLSLNPFDAMTTMTVKIVGQLTGDTDFASPETLVAFALGITLFVITLGLNVLALFIVRKYREQYE